MKTFSAISTFFATFFISFPSWGMTFQGLPEHASISGISADGSKLVGTLAFPNRQGEYVPYACFWDGDLTPHPRDYLHENGFFSYVAVSGDGSIIGGSFNTGAAFWDSAGNKTQLTDPSSVEGATGAVTAVSYTGSVCVGWAFGQAYRWENTVGEGLGVLSGDVTSSATGVSDDGKVVIGNGTDSYGQTHAFRWTKESGMIALSGIPPGSLSEANGISADGKIIVGAYTTQYSWEAFRWTEETGPVSIGHIATVSPQMDKALAISADGSTIVGSGRGGAFIWTAAHGMQSISQIIAGGGIDLKSEWALNIGYRVSADGSIITGGGNFFAHSEPYSSGTRAWILNLTATPTPAPTATATPTPAPPATATPTPGPTTTATPTPAPTATPAESSTDTPLSVTSTPAVARPSLAPDRLPRITHDDSVRVQGSAHGNVSKITYRVTPSQKTGKVVGSSSWHFKVRLRPGRNVVTIVAHGMNGTTTRSKVVVIKH